MKIHRDKRGKFRCGETVAYKMTNHFGQFNRKAEEAFNEAALDKYDFSTCQRPDGSKYGSRGRCIKGSETSPASKDDKKSSSKASGGGGDVAIAPAPKKTTSKDPVRRKNVLNELKAKNKKLSNEYERLRGDNSPQATKRRKAIMEESNKNVRSQKDLLSKMEAGAKSQSPQSPRDSSPAGQQRRANAATRARD